MKHKAKIAAPTEADMRTGAVRAAPARLSAEDSIETAAGRIFLAALDHFAANAAIFAKAETIESVHQMRVALRRLRAAIGLFRSALAGAALRTAAARAKTIASALGPARDGDVFLEMLDAGPGAMTEAAPNLSTLRAAVQRHRNEGYETAHKTLQSETTTIFVDDLRHAVATRDWNAAPGVETAGATRDFAKMPLVRLRKRVLRKSRDLATRTAEERHAARIALKKARYAAEFFESLFENRSAARDFIHRLAELQDALGADNDLAAANRLITHLHADDASLTLPAGFVCGWFAHAARDGVAHARQNEKRLKSLKTFW
jgi:triphosphatase